jgi:DNA polymerase elongation subunit (family B)
MNFQENTVLFGSDPAARLVAVELAGESEIHVYRHRAADGTTEMERVPFAPFLWMDGEQDDIASEPLAGGLAFYRLVTCAGWGEFRALQSKLREREGVKVFALSDPVQQYLTGSGRTLFKGMEFGELRRLQIRIETFCGDGFEFAHADRAGDHLMAIALGDHTGWEELILIEAASAVESEKAALARLNAIIAERDPDVLEGHHLFKFDLPYLAARAKRHRVKLAWGRDGTLLTSRPSRVQIAEKTIQYPKYEVRGRHVIDTFLLLQLYDVGTRELESFGLKDAARHFGILGGGEGGTATAAPDIVESETTTPEQLPLEGKSIQAAYENDPAEFRRHVLEGVRETRALADLLSRSYFIQAQIFPFNYQEIPVRGQATRVNSLFLREYHARRHSLSDFPAVRDFEGGYTDVFFTGVRSDVWHCDVASLYPSVMLNYDVFPATDLLGVFHKLLADLRQFRLAAKAEMRAAAPRSREYTRINALQNVFKVLINSFYGYLGFAQGHFADFDAAARVTETGRDLLKQMVAWLQARGALVIEIDTDGIYFAPPAGVTPAELQAGLGAALPPGIDIEFDAQYRAMFSYKAKNYALLEEDGRLILKGGALKSRGLERFQRQFLERMIRLLLAGRAEEVAALRDEFEQAIRQQRWPIDMLVKADTLQDSLAQYSKKIEGNARNRSAPYELALRSGRDYQPGDQVRYYITGTKKKVSSYENAKLASEWRADARDENVEFYVSKLDELAKKYVEFLPAAPVSQPMSGQGELF